MAVPVLYTFLGAEHLRPPFVSDTEVYDLDQLRADLKACSTDDQRGLFAYTGFCSAYESPGLEVDGIGVLGLPLTDTSALKSIASETTAKTWEVGANQVSFINPKWDTSIQKNLVPLATVELGVDKAAISNTRAELVKLVLQEAGAELRVDDSTSAAGKYGVFEISLPSIHGGGQIIFMHDNYKKTWDTSKGSSYRLSFAGCYTDVDHVSNPIISGHRLLLSYNLVNISGEAL
ncbi:hypothetical protein C1H76_0221 [Elsinoe australis]|uniref:Uncharacterized protein n=1 Tax=Elsinoe australis TaxID=40998 RepID=A0A4U7BFG2_9PEZI|nr:hypothetical protein C1H76_0221 [Elsinoe australis]